MFFAPPQLPPEPPVAAEPAEARPPALPAGPQRLERGPLTLDWDTPASCPAVADLHGLVQRYLSREDVGGETLAVTGRVVEQPGGGWRLSLALARPTETSFRELEAEDCVLLTRAAALVVAVHVDAVGAGHGIRGLEAPPQPSAEELPPPPTGEQFDPRPPVSEEAVVTGPEPLAPRKRPPLRRPPSFGLLRVSGSGGVGDLPGFLREVALTGGAQIRAWRVEGEVGYAPPREATHPVASDVSASFQAISGTLRGCWVSVFERFEIPLCAGVRARGVRGRGVTGVASPTTAWSPSAALAFSPGVVWSPIPEVGLFGSLGIYVGLRRPRFGVGSESEPLFSVSAVSALISIGVEVKIFSRKLPRK